MISFAIFILHKSTGKEAWMTNERNKIEAEWLTKAIDGNEEAFSMLVEHYLPQVYKLCLGLAGNKQDAEDCVQETFLKAWNGLVNFKGQASFYTWIYRIAVNTCIDLRKAASRKMTLSLDANISEKEFSLMDKLSDPSPMPDAIVIEMESGQAIVRAIISLPEIMQEILILRDIQSCTYQEIATLLNIAIGTVKSRLFRARQKVMAFLRAEELNALTKRQNSVDQYKKGEFQ